MREAWFRCAPPGRLSRLRRYLGKPWTEKIRVAGLYARNLFPNFPVPVRLPPGIWWLARNNDLGNHTLAGDFEQSEYAFVGRFLKQGMVVLDIGANEGYYTLLASKCVGAQGRVIGFEPSPRERRSLRINLRVNRCTNVRVERFALVAEEGEVDLHVVEKGETGCNSLRPPDVKGATRTVRVPLTTLDRYLRRHAIRRVDFVKMDIEGAELSALQGASSLLQTSPRPLLLIEISDLRTRPWGYSSREIARRLSYEAFALYRPVRDGQLRMMDMDDVADGSDFNVIAVPQERISEIADFLLTHETQCFVRSDNATP